ncbi:hypothetical protein NZA98_27035, partial [Escherichia coli]|nr:hypothetical protein [Escherichia coli]
TLPPVIAKPAPVIEHFDVPILVRHGNEKQLGRLIIERGRDEYKGTAYLHGGSYHKVHYVGNPVNGGFSHLTSEDFLKKVRDLFASGSAIEFEFPPADTAVEWDNIKQEVEGSR